MPTESVLLTTLRKYAYHSTSTGQRKQFSEEGAKGDGILRAGIRELTTQTEQIPRTTIIRLET